MERRSVQNTACILCVGCSLSNWNNLVNFYFLFLAPTDDFVELRVVIFITVYLMKASKRILRDKNSSARKHVAVKRHEHPCLKSVSWCICVNGNYLAYIQFHLRKFVNQRGSCSFPSFLVWTNITLDLQIRDLVFKLVFEGFGVRNGQAAIILANEQRLRVRWKR